MSSSTSELDMLVKDNERLQKENELFESYLMRHSQGLAEALEEEVKTPKHKKRGKDRHKVQSELLTEQKVAVASSEADEVQKEIKETKKHSEKLIDTLRAILEETDVRIAELKKDAYEFKRDIVVGAENFRTGKTMAEKVIRYMEEKLRQKDAVVEKLRLKNAQLKSQIQKVDQQLRQKEEMGDVLHYIDFHQLGIENKQYMAKIEERNQELLKLKMTTGNTVQVLNNLKRKLGDLIMESEWLKREIKSRTEMLVKIKEDNGRVQQDIARAKQENIKFKMDQEDAADSPQVLDYVAQKAEMYELQSAVKNWERKLEIAEMAARRRTKRR